MPDILLVVVFILWDPTIIGSRADTKKQLVVVRRGRFRFTESRRGASSADRSSMLQMNETDLRKNATPPRLFSNTTEQWRAVATKQTFDLRHIKTWPNLLDSLLFGPRSPFWTASCPSKLLFLKSFIIRSTNTLFAINHTTRGKTVLKRSSRDQKIGRGIP